MIRRAKILTESRILIPVAPTGLGHTFANPENTVVIQPPIGLFCTRITIQILPITMDIVIGVLISTQQSLTGVDGFLLQTTSDPNLLGQVQQPRWFTFENFQDEGIKDSFYLSNVSASGDLAPVCIIYEGFIYE